MNNLVFIVFVFWQESAEGLINAPSRTAIEPTIINLVSWLRLFMETTSAVIIAFGVLLAIYEFARIHFISDTKTYTKIRLLLARYLALGLEFQLGAEILSTAIAPSWDQIGKLGAIAVIRTALNYFLTREMEQEREITENEKGLDGK
jgi:uncharacterized membrane protein